MKNTRSKSLLIIPGKMLIPPQIALLFTILTSLPAILSAQDQDTLLVKGRVINSKSQKPLAYSHLIKNDTTGSVTDENGNFFISVTSGDTLLISHISHKEKKRSFSEIKKSYGDSLIIALQPQSYSIDAVTVRPLGTYAEFKQEFLKLNTLNKSEKKAAARIRHLPMLQPKANNNQTQNLSINKQLSGPPSVKIFSTSKDEGILGFINALMEND